MRYQANEAITTFIFSRLSQNRSHIMDFLPKVLNILVPPITLIILLCFLPPYLLFRFPSFIKRSLFPEKVAGKVILFAGASSGIGEHLAYEYSKRGACLALVARRENRLKQVANRTMSLGSPDVIIIPPDISGLGDCKRFVHSTVSHFGRLDHLVSNAGIFPVCSLDQSTDITNSAKAMLINQSYQTLAIVCHWTPTSGAHLYGIYFAIPHLRESRGKIIRIGSCASWLPGLRMILYNASKAAVVSLYESLRTELGDDRGITIVNPGLIESEMTQGKFLNEEGRMILDQEMRDVLVTVMPIRSVTEAAKAIVKSACRGDKYLTEPGWMRTSLYRRMLYPEALECNNRFLLILGSSERVTERYN